MPYNLIMSKAFTGESDFEEEEIPPPPLPPGTRNYMTPDGEKRLRAERDKLIQEKATTTGGGFEDQRRPKSIDRRLEFLNQRLNAAQVIDPAQQIPDKVRFGAHVTLTMDQSEAQTWRIVGLDEVDLDKGWISWMSPLASALLEKKVGDTAFLNNRRLTILKIDY
jgi:transcription elongation factor GreB